MQPTTSGCPATLLPSTSLRAGRAVSLSNGKLRMLALRQAPASAKAMADTQGRLHSHLSMANSAILPPSLKLRRTGRPSYALLNEKGLCPLFPS